MQTEQAICKSQNGELEKGMREKQRIRWEFGCGEGAWECGESGWKWKNVGNQGGDAGNQGGNLSIAVDITWNSNGNNKLKDWR